MSSSISGRDNYAIGMQKVAYNVVSAPYNDGMNHVMTVSRNGQVSIPAAARARWKAKKVVVVDMGDYVVVRPVSDDPIRELRGVLRGRGPSTDEMRRMDREEEAEREDARNRR